MQIFIATWPEKNQKETLDSLGIFKRLISYYHIRETKPEWLTKYKGEDMPRKKDREKVEEKTKEKVEEVSSSTDEVVEVQDVEEHQTKLRVVKQFPDGEDYEEEKTIEVNRFVTTPAKIRIGFGETLPTDVKYKMMRIDVSIEVPCYPEELEDAYVWASELLEDFYNQEKDFRLKEK